MPYLQELWGHVDEGAEELRKLHRRSEATAPQPGREYQAVAHEGLIFL